MTSSQESNLKFEHKLDQLTKADTPYNDEYFKWDEEKGQLQVIGDPDDPDPMDIQINKHLETPKIDGDYGITEVKTVIR